jgi:hypothetical protein
MLIADDELNGLHHTLHWSEINTGLQEDVKEENAAENTFVGND